MDRTDNLLICRKALLFSRAACCFVINTKHYTELHAKIQAKKRYLPFCIQRINHNRGHLSDIRCSTTLTRKEFT